MISLVWFAVFDAAIYFAPTFTWILVLRTIFGFGMGAEWTAGTALAMESLPARSRGIASGLLQAGWPIGYLLAAATAYFVVPAFGWRAMFILAAVPALLVVPDPRSWSRTSEHEAPSRARRRRRPARRPARPRMLVLGVARDGARLRRLLRAHGLYTASSSEHGLDMQPARWPVDPLQRRHARRRGRCRRVANRCGIIPPLVVPALLMVVAMPLFVGLVPGPPRPSARSSAARSASATRA